MYTYTEIQSCGGGGVYSEVLTTADKVGGGVLKQKKCRRRLWTVPTSILYFSQVYYKACRLYECCPFSSVKTPDSQS